jgi:hypothetical protein
MGTKAQVIALSLFTGSTLSHATYATPYTRGRVRTMSALFRVSAYRYCSFYRP